MGRNPQGTGRTVNRPEILAENKDYGITIKDGWPGQPLTPALTARRWT